MVINMKKVHEDVAFFCVMITIFRIIDESKRENRQRITYNEV
jgi:hypothetical protein